MFCALSVMCIQYTYMSELSSFTSVCFYKSFCLVIFSITFFILIGKTQLQMWLYKNGKHARKIKQGLSLVKIDYLLLLFLLCELGSAATLMMRKYEKDVQRV